MKTHVLAVSLLVLVSCAPASDPPSTSAGLSAEDESAIRQLISDWDVAFGAHDMEAATALYADDYREARVASVEDRATALELYNDFGITYSDVNSTVTHIEGSGDLAYAMTEFESRYTRNDDQERRIQNGHSLWVFRKGADGQWRFVAGGFQASSRADPSGD